MDSQLQSFLESPPYALNQQEKRTRLLPALQSLSQHHYQHSSHFRACVDGAFGGEQACAAHSLEALPFLPVSLFKQFMLSSIPEEAIFKRLMSSGTTGQTPSTVILDRETAQLQTTALVKLMQHFLGKDRLPLVIVDHPGILKDRNAFSARAAGIKGMLPFGRKPLYALDDQMQLQVGALRDYLDKHAGTPVLFFGFTFMVWQYLLSSADLNLHCAPGSLLIHSGGWKKLEDQRVSPETFRTAAQKALGLERVVNFYGMVEQVGSVFFENPAGYLQASAFSEIIIRDPVTLAPLPVGEEGLIQVLSVLPKSYPGHSILTEDMGVLMGEDHPDTQMGGRYFRVTGRLKSAEVRGCSDTFEAPKGDSR